jgi:hypothetical protein
MLWLCQVSCCTTVLLVHRVRLLCITIEACQQLCAFSVTAMVLLRSMKRHTVLLIVRGATQHYLLGALDKGVLLRRSGTVAAARQVPNPC